ncbi:MAG: type II secretion system protein [bacterium]|nr:type II secretion system protein [bacterium]
MNTRAFTLIETMVAVTILTLAVTGALFTANRAIVAAQSARDRLTASHLAQEGIEHVRAMRDDEYLVPYPLNTADAWGNFLRGPISECRAPGICTLGIMQAGVLPLASCPDDADGGCTETFSLLSNGTSYRRTIQVVDAAPSPSGITTDVRVVSAVSWDFHGVLYSVSVNDHLTPWQ